MLRSNETEMEENSISSRLKHNVKSRKFSIAVCVHGIVDFLKALTQTPRNFQLIIKNALHMIDA